MSGRRPDRYLHERPSTHSILLKQINDIQLPSQSEPPPLSTLPASSVPLLYDSRDRFPANGRLDTPDAQIRVASPILQKVYTCARARGDWDEAAMTEIDQRRLERLFEERGPEDGIAERFSDDDGAEDDRGKEDGAGLEYEGNGGLEAEIEEPAARNPTPVSGLVDPEAASIRSNTDLNNLPEVRHVLRPIPGELLQEEANNDDVRNADEDPQNHATEDASTAGDLFDQSTRPDTPTNISQPCFPTPAPINIDQGVFLRRLIHLDPARL